MSARFPQERRDYIEKMLLSEGRIRVSELAEMFDVSTETIRKDLQYLEEKGVAKKGYGGAIVANERLEPSFLEKSIIHQDEKTRIARAVADMIEDGSIIMMDAGSTVYTVAKALGIKSNLSVFTNAPRTAQALDDSNIKTYLFGGELRTNSSALVGEWAVRAINEIRADVAIIGTSGFFGRQGPCVENFPEADIKKAMLKNANKIIVVGDSSKASSSAIIQYCFWDDIDVFVTDSGMTDEWIGSISAKTSVVAV